MNNRGTAFLTAAFSLVLLVLAAGYFVLRTYTPPASATPVTPEVRQFGLSLHGFKADQATMRYWVPSTIVVNVGDTVILRVTNHDADSSHGFALAAFNISVSAIAPGKTETFRFRATRSGIYHYGCGLAGCAPDHAAQTGQLVVLGSQ